ncbi:alpha-amylase family glycosyl hydrolase [Ascidiimonas aurantiaca]|uniref:alpha-amylase family glycosyl hydrolase n=1 Tax=Ascidiimonas aurantiaca TaxID=1685432 RepID=UPI0030EF24F3
MYKYIHKVFIASTFLAVTSCQPQKKVQKPSLITTIATPIYLSSEKDTLWLSDYFPDTSLIDSIQAAVGFRTEVLKNQKKIVIWPEAQMPFMANLRIWTQGAVNDIPVYKSNEEKVDFTLADPQKKYASVKIKGSFNGWVPERSVMIFNEGKWQYTARLAPGVHPYLFVADGEEMADPANPEKLDNGAGGANSVFYVGKKATPPFLTTEHIKNGSFSLKSDQELDSLFIYLNNQLLDAKFIHIDKNNINVTIPGYIPQGRAHIKVYAYNENGRANDLLIPLQDGIVVNIPEQLTRKDFHTQIMYFLMVDRFFDGEPSNTRKVKHDSILPKANYYGGDLQGVVKKIQEGYFQELGVNTIWLSPITQNPEGAYGLWKKPYTRFSGYHGYWPISNTKIDDRFGTDEVLENLIDQAHDQDMNVILDYVANHVHEEHPLYKKHPDWATNLYLPDGTLNTERWDDHRLTTWFDTFLPTLNLQKKQVYETMTDSAVFWVTRYKLDGFRHDATKHIPEVFWRELTRKVRNQVNRPVYQIGETYGSYELIRSYVSTGMLDAQFDFNLYDASVYAFVDHEHSFEPLVNALKQSLSYYGTNHLMGNITGNQDRARFISYASGDVKFTEDAKLAGWTRDIGISDSTAYKKLEMLHAFNLSIPGIPCIYYGDEFGSPGGNDPDNRRMMKFAGLTGKEKHLRTRVSRLTALRRNSMALLYGTTSIPVSNDSVLIIKRKYFDHEAVTIFNKSERPETFQFFNQSITVMPGDYKMVVKP